MSRGGSIWFWDIRKAFEAFKGIFTLLVVKCRPLWAFDSFMKRQMSTILQTILYGYYFNKIIDILIKIELKFVSWNSIHKNPSLIQIMAWHWTGTKSLTEPMMAWSALMCKVSYFRGNISYCVIFLSICTICTTHGIEKYTINNWVGSFNRRCSF